MGIHVFVAPPEAPVLIQRIGYWGTMTPQDPFALYRTVLMMERISMISGFNLNRAHTAVSRHPIGPFANRYLSDIQKMVGPGVHEEIMSTQIQGDVIAFLLSMPDELATQMGHLVVSELDAGTLVWRPAYARFGIEPVGIS
ncbi:hypothetical protein KC573_04620, partial [candidate division WWE3 bacterium]|nr:hypothetical protein [candidate division WWE3 bacterium]